MGEPYTLNTSWMGAINSGTEFNQSVSGLAPGTLYFCRAQANRSGNVSNGDEAIFLTTSDNIPPDTPIPTPADNSSVKSTFFLLRVLVTDPDGDMMNVSFYWPDGTLMGGCLNVTNNSYANMSIATIPGATYRWFVIVNDSNAATRGPATGNWTFTVKEEEEEPDEGEKEKEPEEPEEEGWVLPIALHELAIILSAIVSTTVGIAYKIWQVKN